LNGVLPEPWLPLKKGQTLVSGRRDHNRAAKDDAVVLTLRKRSSKAFRRSTSRTPIERNGNDVLNRDLLSPPGASSAVSDPTLNPWSDVRPHYPLRQQSEPLNYDHATGVIILPDEDGWLDEEGDSSDEVGYGGNHGLDQSITESLISTTDEGTVEGAGSGTPLNSTRQSRYGTYFHHPERRRQPIPGAFPTR